MPAKKTKGAKTAPPSAPLGRPAFPSNLLPIANSDLARPAGAVQLQVPHGQEKTAKPGTSTITMMNPNPPTAAATPPSPSTHKRG